MSAAIPASDALKALEARQTEEGSNLVIVQGADDAELRFRREVEGIWLAADTRIYLDSLRDPRRGKEQAQIFASRSWESDDGQRGGLRPDFHRPLRANARDGHRQPLAEHTAALEVGA